MTLTPEQGWAGEGGRVGDADRSGGLRPEPVPVSAKGACHSRGTAYYNEIDPFAAAWLRELIAAGHIAPGVVDERDIRDVRPDELAGFVQCHFFAGIGVWSYALRRAGWPDEQPVWTGSCPCQPFSEAGQRKGFADERHLWPAWFHLIGFGKPPIVFGEQVAGGAGRRWLDIVAGDLEASGFAVGSAELCAAPFGSPQPRERLFFVADGLRVGLEKPGIPRKARGMVAGAARRRWERNYANISCPDGRKRHIEPGISPLVAITTARVGRVRGYGNAINAEVATGFIGAVMDHLAAAPETELAA